MSRLRANLRHFLLPLLGALALGLTGCGDSDRLSYATEIDEPAYREGQALLKTGRTQEALNAFLKVIDKRGEDAPESHLEVGLLYLQHINDPLSAIYHFRRYLALRPNSPQATLIRQRIDAATRDFARTIPAQPLENQLQRLDLVATLDRLKQENESLKQDLADLKAGRPESAILPRAEPDNSPAARSTGTTEGFTFSAESSPVLHTKPPSGTTAQQSVPTPPKNLAPAKTTPAKVTPAKALPIKPAATAARRHTVGPGDTLSKLAQQYYGNRAKWHDIYAANRDVMKSETDLKTGMQLKIP